MNTRPSVQTIIIDSIGTASPTISKVLSESLEVPIEIVTKALYRAPSVLVKEAPDEVLGQFLDLLSQLGLEVHAQATTDPLPPESECLDVGLYLEDASLLPKVCDQLCSFLGCTSQEALNLLLSEPCVILGHVSQATVSALENRMDAEVVVSDPEAAQYTLAVLSNDRLLLSQLKDYLKTAFSLVVDWNSSKAIPDLDYATSQIIYRRYQSTGGIQLINQDFQRFEVVLTEMDPEDEAQRAALVSLTGMPEEIVNEVAESLPIQVEASINRAILMDTLQAYADAGLTVEANLLSHTHHQLVLEEIKDLKKSREILSQFVPEDALPKTGHTPWYSPVPMSDLLARFAIAQLEAVGTSADYEPISVPSS